MKKSKLKNKLAVGLAGLLTVSAMSAAVVSAAETDYDLSYAVIAQGFDWGASVTKVIVDFGKEVPEEIVLSPDQVKVNVKKTYAGTDTIVQALDYSTGEYVSSPAGEGQRQVENVYLCDAQGNPVQGATNYAAVEMKVGPTEGFGDVLGAETETGIGLNVVLDCSYTVTFKDDTGKEYICETENENSDYGLTDLFVHNQIYETETPELLEDGLDNDKLYYASYEPGDEETHPLIIWLHGMGEGGTDTRVAVMGNKVTALVDEEIQGIMGGAYVLVPQSPTLWMNTEGTATTEMKAGTTKSIYTEVLMELIEQYVKDHPGIDTNRIYLGGCSNGGYMTVNMLIEYPEYFAAAYPICEAYKDEFITDEQIETLAGIPIWFTQSAADPVVVPEMYVVPTYKRLAEAGAQDLHFTYWTDVHDTSGQFTDETGAPAGYFGHLSWIYALNNECTMDNDYVEGKTTDNPGSGTTLFQWLADHSK